MDSEGGLFQVKWRLNEDGAGTADLFFAHGVEVCKERLAFTSLDELGDPLSTWIREDGRPEGALPLPPFSN